MRAGAQGAGAPAIEVHSLSALLHNRPVRIVPAVEALAARLQAAGKRVVLAYADCGTYGALDVLCERMGIERLDGLHCYDVVAGTGTVASLFDEEAGTYVLTDFLASAFRRLVVAELGLDRHPNLVHDYFAHYRRMVWLACRRTPELEREARAAADTLGLPLEIREVDAGNSRRALVRLMSRAMRPVSAPSVAPAVR